jgi:hypothetical protein
MVALLDMGDGSYIELVGPTAGVEYGQTATTAPALLHIALATTDARAATDHVRQAGYEVTVEPKEASSGLSTALTVIPRERNASTASLSPTTPILYIHITHPFPNYVWMHFILLAC